MRGIFTKASLVLEPRQAVSGIAGEAQVLQVLHGQIWLTVEGVSHDYWLYAGDSFPAVPGRVIVIEADKGGSRVDIVSVQRPAMLEQIGKRIRTIVQRLAFGKASQAGAQQCTLARCPGQS
ncbi:hypothetical protein GCM10027343_11020 [Noviherbaspirillum agri]